MGVPFHLIFAAVFAFSCSPLFSQSKEEVDASLKRLKSEDMDERIEGLRGLLTSLDPRIPEALLPLLSDEGNSTRRLAARAVGSRWWQIPTERLPAFIAALDKNKGTKLPDEKNMVMRGLGLLRGDFAGDMFARSANGRWVIYERRGLPCLIDTKTMTEELLGWSRDVDRPGWLNCAWGNDPVADAVIWHPEKELAVLDIIVNRRATAIWVWRHEKGLKKIEPLEVLAALGFPGGGLFSPGGFYTRFKKWAGDEMVFEASFGIESGDSIIEYEATVGLDTSKGTMREVSKTRL